MNQFTQRIIGFGVHAGHVEDVAGGNSKLQTTLHNFRWQAHCRGLYQLPAAA